MNHYFLLKWLHILSSTVLFGTGVGSAYYMLCACLSRDARLIARVAGLVVLADWIFTASTVLIQPLTGWLLLRALGLQWEPAVSLAWVRWSIILYLIAGAAWLPVVWIQYRMRDLARHAADGGSTLTSAFFRLLLVWICLGAVAFVALMVVFYLMVAKPA
jgi:uncharacterized membrane protein